MHVKLVVTAGGLCMPLSNNEHLREALSQNLTLIHTCNGTRISVLDYSMAEQGVTNPLCQLTKWIVQMVRYLN